MSLSITQNLTHLGLLITSNYPVESYIKDYNTPPKNINSVWLILKFLYNNKYILLKVLFWKIV